MRLEGWNHVPHGYGATFDIGGAPWWLRAWFRTPFVDRFAYPVLVDRGLGWLTVHPGPPTELQAPVPKGWLIRGGPDDPIASTVYLRPDSDR
jgi:hypothetical protein